MCYGEFHGSLILLSQLQDEINGPDDSMNLCRDQYLLPIVPTELLLRLRFLSSFLTPCRCSIFQIPKLGTKLKQDALQLTYTPRKFTTHPGNSYFYLIESDHRVLGEVAAATKLQELVKPILHLSIV